MTTLLPICGDKGPSPGQAAGLLILLLAFILPPAACGYHLAGYQKKTPEGIRTIAIVPLGNKTTTPRIEQIMTRALVEQFSERTSLEVASQKNGADSFLEGEVVSVNAAPILFGREGFANTYLLSIQASLRIIRSKDGKVIYENQNFLFRDQYLIDSDIRQFFSEQTVTIERIARDFASSVVAAFLENMR